MVALTRPRGKQAPPAAREAGPFPDIETQLVKLGFNDTPWQGPDGNGCGFAGIKLYLFHHGLLVSVLESACPYHQVFC